MTFVLADMALDMTLALIGVFFVLFPLLAHGLIGIAIAGALGERQQNRQYAEEEDLGPTRH
jgi:hypothetical protein